MDERIWGLDVGNTHSKIGVIEGDKILQVFRFRTEVEQSLDEYYFRWKSICHELGWDRIPPLWVASVVPAVSIAIDRLSETRNLEVHRISPKNLFNFRIPPYLTEQIGADILIMAEAATHLVGSDAIVVSAGTATVVFAIDNGLLVGGAIAPGIKGSVESLIERAALLSPVYLDLPDRAIGQNTREAMQSGILYGFAGLVDGLVSRFKEELHKPDIPVIACGGMIGKLGKISHTIQKVYPDLGLHGIAFLAAREMRNR